MKNFFLCFLLLIVSLELASCSGNDESNVSVSVSGATLPLIPATTASCLSLKSTTPTQDISPSYFKVPKITFTRKVTTTILFIAVLRIKISVPGTGTQISCEAGGDTLASLSSVWWSAPGKDTTIPVGQSTFETDCALYCGGISAGDTSYTGTGTMEIFGVERNPTTLVETPVKVTTTISIQNF